MHVLISNDDGIKAPALFFLKEFFENRNDKVTIVVPNGNRSAAGMSLSLSKPMKVEENGDCIFSVDGTPCDCINYALTVLNNKYDLVLSGINEGSNVGQEIWYSGTIAAARLANFNGYPTMSISLDKTKLTKSEWKNVFMNLDFYFNDWLKQVSKKHTMNINLPKKATEQICEAIETIVGNRKYINHLVFNKNKDGYIYEGEIIKSNSKKNYDNYAIENSKISITYLENNIL
jgi:5'-nucleotidase